jgi:hypothetical protein
MIQEVIDVHAHCFTARTQNARVADALGKLRAVGVSHLVVVGLINTRLDAEAMWDLIPRYVENRGNPLFHEAEDLLALAEANRPALLPFVDTRHLWGSPLEVLPRYLAQGFRGLKGIYLADDRNDLGVRGVPEALGISLEAYRKREWELFSLAEAHDLPLVYHMDARMYGDVMAAVLEDFPRLRVDFAHLGISRKAFGKVLERHPNVYTDLASMLPHVRRDPRGYRDFILNHADRVCFGSDAILYAADTTVPEYLEMVRRLELPEEVEEMVCSANPRRFLGKALPEPG